MTTEIVLIRHLGDAHRSLALIALIQSFALAVRIVFLWTRGYEGPTLRIVGHGSGAMR